MKNLSLKSTYFLYVLQYIFLIVFSNVYITSNPTNTIILPYFVCFLMSFSTEWFILHYFSNEISPLKSPSFTSRDVIHHLLNTFILPVLFLYFAPIDYYFTPITILSFATLSCEMVLAGGLFDIVSFRIFHVFAHLYYYNHHKVHHEATMNTTALNGNRFHPLDSILETVGYVWIYPLVKYLLGFECKMHSFAFIQLIWMQYCTHSANPYFPTCQVSDIFMKMNLAHQLHHATTNSYFGIVPYHHLFGWEDDVRQYNRLLKMKDREIDFPYWIF